MRDDRPPTLVLTLAVLAFACGTEPARLEKEPPPRAPVAAPPSSSVAECRVARTGLRETGTLARALAALEVPSEERGPLIGALSGLLDLRRLPAQTGIAACRGPDGRLARLSVRHARDRFVRVEIDDGGVKSVGTVELPIRESVRTAEAVVTTSVAAAFSEMPSGPRLTLDFADIFQWDVDLMVEPRPGDRVRVVFELLHLGELPVDLPRFGRELEREGERFGYGRILAGSYDGAVARAEAFWLADGQGGSYFDRSGKPLRKSFLKSPLSYRRISSRFSRARRNPVTRQVVPHHGVDYAAAAGTPVVAAADGRVVSTGWAGALGRTVRLRHGSEYVTLYGHLRGVAKGIRAGIEVRQNQVIGYVGSSGRATGPHLHYTVLLRGRPIDPLRMDNPPVGPLEPGRRPALERVVERYGPLLDENGSPRAIAGLGIVAADDGT